MTSAPHTHDISLVDSSTIRVLLTGFGTFHRYNDVNPSAYIAKLLHNAIFYTQPPPPTLILADPLPSSFASTSSEDLQMTDPNIIPHEPQRIHVTALEIPVTYQAVLTTIPALHARPPRIPYPKDQTMKVLPPPANGYDFIFHLGVAGRGPLRIEKLSHKFGYRMRDAEGSYAPVVHLPKEDLPDLTGPDAESFLIGTGLTFADINRGGADGSGVTGQIEAAGAGGGHPGGSNSDGMEHQPNRGFGKGYENASDELYTDIDVARLIHHLQENGVEHVYSSMDSGHFLTDFIFYCSLAEAKRTAGKLEKDKGTPPKSVPVLAMHIPPVNLPLSEDEMVDAIKKIILWVVGGRQG